MLICTFASTGLNYTLLIQINLNANNTIYKTIRSSLLLKVLENPTNPSCRCIPKYNALNSFVVTTFAQKLTLFSLISPTDQDNCFSVIAYARVYNRHEYIS